MRETCRQGDLQQAAEKYREAIILNQADAWAYCQLGAVLDRLGRRDEAAVALLTAIRLVPEFALAHRCLGSLNQRQGNSAQAVLHFTRAERLEAEAQSQCYSTGPTTTAWCM